MSKTLKKVLNIIIDIVVVLILVLSIIVIVLSLTSRSTGIPNIFGIVPMSVLSDSMKPEFEQGDLIFCKVVGENDEQLKKGDIVSFYDDIDGEQQINTHRISRIETDTSSGLQYIFTKGDNAPDEDTVRKTNLDILAKYTGKRISGLGNFFSFIRTQLGFFLVILLPMILFFVYEAVRVIMNIIAYNKEKAAEEAAAAVANSELTEEQKQRAIEEYLAQQKLKQEGETAVQTPAADEQSGAEK